MNRFALFFALLFNCILCSCKAQHLAEKNYIDLVIKQNRLYALTKSGHINIYNVNTGVAIDTNVHTNTAITAISSDKKGDIVVITKNGEIDTLGEKKLTFKRWFASENPAYGIVFDRNNNAFLITTKGIYDVLRKKTYRPDTSFRLNHQITGWSMPSAVLMDEDDNIWVGSGHGEWGGELFVFNTRSGQFIKPILNNFEIDLYPVKSIFSDGKTVYISCGLDHMMTSGCIVKFILYKSQIVFLSESHWADNSKKQNMIKGEYIGPALYSKTDNSIFFYSQNGIFKGDVNADLTQINKWTKVASPKLHWVNGQIDAVGSPMNVLKMEFAANGKLFILTQNDGIGVYDGKAFVLLN